MSPPRLAVVSTHPIQYNAPLFRALAERGAVAPHVFYGYEGAAGQAAHDHGFGEAFAWDVPLLDGYASTFVDNVADDPGPHHFKGIDTPGLVAEIEAWRPEAVLVFGWSYRSHLGAMRHFHRRVPVLFRGDSTLIDEPPGLVGALKRTARRAVLRWVYRHVDVALTVGTHNRAYFRAHGLREDQLVWAPHAVDTTRFAAGDDAEAVAWRRELGIGEGDRVVVFAGKLEPKKAPEVLLEAFLRYAASASERPAHLAVVGSGPLEAALHARAAGHPNVHFLGFQNQSRMPTVYRLGDVLALPSRGPGETWGLAVNEAMASGRAVIVSDKVGCAPDLVDDRNGRVVPAGDVPALAAALEAVLADGVAEPMGAVSRERIRGWSIEAEAERIEAAVIAAAGR
ncbi:MAG: glycosyltransferase family 4 protein [Bacteroidota bacterium]